MTAYSVNDDVFKTPAAHAYFGRADARFMCGVRAALELLGVPLPDYAKRKPAGRPPGSKSLAKALDADLGVTPTKPITLPPMSERRQAGQLREAQARVDRQRASKGLPPTKRDALKAAADPASNADSGVASSLFDND
jgi:hypothetical protein